MNEKVAVGLGLVVAIAGGFGAAQVIKRPAKTQRNIEFLYDMAYSPAVESQRVYLAQDKDGNRIMPEGIQHMAPPEGTVYRRGLYGAPDIGAIYPYITNDAGDFVLPQPAEGQAPDELAKSWTMPATASAERGRMLFHRACTPCHGQDGKGNTPVVSLATNAEGVQRARFPKPPNPLWPTPAEKQQILGINPATYTEGQIFFFISNGIRVMPSYERFLTPAQRWDVVAYVKQMQKDAAEGKTK